MNNKKPRYTPSLKEIAEQAAKIKREYLASGRCVRGDSKVGRGEKTVRKANGAGRRGKAGK